MIFFKENPSFLETQDSLKRIFNLIIYDFEKIFLKYFENVEPATYNLKTYLENKKEYIEKVINKKHFDWSCCEKILLSLLKIKNSHRAAKYIIKHEDLLLCLNNLPKLSKKEIIALFKYILTLRKVKPVYIQKLSYFFNDYKHSIL